MQAFADRLQQEFGGRLRLRWSQLDHQWMLEEKVGRASLPARPGSEMNDQWIRARDGYALVLTIAPGDREGCKHCSQTIKLPVFDFAETACPACGKLTRSCHWPLNDMLMQHLRMIDPLRDGPSKARDEADRATAAAAAGRQRDTSNAIESITKDNINQLGGFTVKGYTGREHMWER